MLRVATLFIAIAALSAFAQTAPAQEQPLESQAAVNRAKARLYPSAPGFPSPQPSDEIRNAFPRAYTPRLVRLADGNLALSVPRDSGMRAAYWLVILDANGAPVRQVLAVDYGVDRESPIQTRDGGFLLHGGGGGERWITRIDGEGRELWMHDLPDFIGRIDTFLGAVETDDGGFLLAGSGTGGRIGRGAAPLVERIDRHGNTLWRRMIGKLGRFDSQIVVAMPDGDFTLYGAGGLFRLDARGRPRWRVAMFRTDCLVPSADGSVFVAGTHHSGPKGKMAEPFVARLDRRGRLLWRHIGYPPEAIGSEILVTGATPAPDGGVFMMLRHGWDGDGALPGFDTLALARYAANGKLLWWRTVSAADEPDQPLWLADAAALPNGQVLITAYDRRAAYQRGDLWLRVLPLD